MYMLQIYIIVLTINIFFVIMCRKRGDGNLKNKSVFSKIMLLVILCVVCIILTIGVALFAGSYSTTLFDFSNLNFANMIPVLMLGGFISFVIIVIAVIYVSRSIFIKVKDNFINTKENNGGNKK